MARRPRMQGMESCVVRLARSVTNPFEESSCIPDGSTGTGIFTLRETSTLQTGTAGTCYGILVGPNPNAFQKIDTLSTAGVPTLGGNWVGGTGNATVINQYSAYRAVSGGIKVSYTGNTQTDGGSLILAQFSGDLAPSNLNTLSLQQLANLSQYYRTYPLRNGGVITWRPEEMDDQDTWLPTTSVGQSLSVQNAQPYLCAFVYAAQPSGASSVQVEYVFNFEGQFRLQNFLAGGIRSRMLEPATPGWYERAKNMVASIPPIVPLVGAIAKTYMLSQTGLNSRLPMLTAGPSVEELD